MTYGYGHFADVDSCNAGNAAEADTPGPHETAADLLTALEQILDTMEPPRSRKASEAWDAAHAAVRRARAVAD